MNGKPQCNKHLKRHGILGFCPQCRNIAEMNNKLRYSKSKNMESRVWVHNENKNKGSINPFKWSLSLLGPSIQNNKKFWHAIKKSSIVSIGYTKLRLTPSKRFCTPNGFRGLSTSWWYSCTRHPWPPLVVVLFSSPLALDRWSWILPNLFNLFLKPRPSSTNMSWP